MSSGMGVNVKLLESILAEGATDAQRVTLCAIPSAAFAVFDSDLRVRFADGDAVRAVHSNPQRDVEGRTVADVLGRRTAPLLRAYRQAIAGESVELDVEYHGRVYWVHAAPIRDADGAVLAGLSISLDVTEQRREEADVRRRAREQSAIATLGRRALEGASEARLLNEGVEAVATTLGVHVASVMRLDEAAGHLTMSAGVGWARPPLRHHPVPITDAHRRVIRRLADGPEILLDVSERDPDGPLLAGMGVASMMAVLIGPQDRAYGWLSALSFSTRQFLPAEADFLQAVANVLWSAIERADADEEYRHAALHDELTGLANRRLFIDRLEQALDRARNERCAAAVLLLDVDNFKVINDSLGHDGGDVLLRALTARLQAAARCGDTVARLGSDEFAIVCDGVISEAHAMAIAYRIATALREPIELGHHRHVVKASIGVVVADGDSRPVSLLRDADTAMHRAKERGGGRVERFSQAMRRRVVARMRTESELHGAVERDELRVHFQPFFSIPDRRLLGMEALVRWQHPQRGLVLPDEFIPLAEQNGQIMQLGAWVLDAAARAVAGLRASLACCQGLTVSVNVSARQLLPAEDGALYSLPHIVAQVLAEANLPPERLALEITESMLMEAGEESESVLLELKRLGVQLMLDDFGTGHSSLSRLSDFPLDSVKIDRRFVRGLGQNEGREPIVTAIIAMARALDLHVIAEGVETEEEWQGLSALGCEAAQGFALARPMPAEQVGQLLAGGSGDVQAA